MCVKRHGAGERGSMDKQERMMASLREREKVVQQSLSVSLRERDREREQHLKEEAVQHFGALLADMVIHFFFSFQHNMTDTKRHYQSVNVAVLSMTVFDCVDTFLSSNRKRIRRPVKSHP